MSIPDMRGRVRASPGTWGEHGHGGREGVMPVIWEHHTTEPLGSSALPWVGQQMPQLLSLGMTCCIGSLPALGRLLPEDPKVPHLGGVQREPLQHPLQPTARAPV
jgi:hypothetical protein